MIGHWAQQFRFFLDALKGEVCPLCVLSQIVETDGIQRIGHKPSKSFALCGEHLARLIASGNVSADRVTLVRSALGASMRRQGGPDCMVCAMVGASVQRLNYAISWLDSRPRFQRALEQAPLFCRRHSFQIAQRRSTANFIHVEQRKVQKLINDLAQAQLRKLPAMDGLIERSVAYLAAVPQVLEPNVSEPFEKTLADFVSDSPDAEVHEFTKWDAERQLEYLGKLESEAASLRYRNRVLTEENRALKIARIAQESIRRDLERDRARFLEERKAQGKDS